MTNFSKLGISEKNMANKRSDKQIQDDRKQLRDVISQQFANREFQLNEVYNFINDTFNASKSGMMYADFRALTIAKFLKYRMKPVGKLKRAFYSLAQEA